MSNETSSKKGFPRSISDTHRLWSNLSIYQRFEQIIALILSFLVAVVIVTATWNLLRDIVILISQGGIEPSHSEVFQGIFGRIMIVLIALEFNHSILSLVDRGRSIVQVRTVVLIALLAVLRKFIVIDIADSQTELMLGLAFSALALGAVLWTLRGRDRFDDPDV